MPDIPRLSREMVVVPSTNTTDGNLNSMPWRRTG